MHFGLIIFPTDYSVDVRDLARARVELEKALCGQIGVMQIASTPGSMMGPPAETL